MAMLAKTTFPAALGSSGSSLVANTPSSNMPPTRRAPTMVSSGQGFASPTESEFSDVDGPGAVKNWNEDQVCEYLRSVKCGEYEKLFRKNHINGENLLEMDKEVLKEMGIEKVGDRVRLFLGIKKLRTKAYANMKKRNRVSCAAAGASALFVVVRGVNKCTPRILLVSLTLSSPRPQARRGRPTRAAAGPCLPPPQTRGTPDSSTPRASVLSMAPWMLARAAPAPAHHSQAPICVQHAHSAIPTSRST